MTSIKRFLGQCAFVMETLRDFDSVTKIKIPANVKRIAPVTESLSDREIQRMKFYKSEYMEMKGS